MVIMMVMVMVIMIMGHDGEDDWDLDEVQGSPWLPEERSQQGDAGSRGPHRNQNLRMDLVDKFINGIEESCLASKKSHSHPVGQLLHSPFLGSLVLEPDLKTHMVLIGLELEEQ